MAPPGRRFSIEIFARMRAIAFSVVNGLVLIVVHTLPENDNEQCHRIGRIISARKADRHERKAYEEGHG